MQVIPFPSIFNHQAHYVIEGLLDKNESVVLCGVFATQFAIQAACDVANEKSFLEKFATAPENPVLFVTQNKGQFANEAQALARRISKTPNARLVVLNDFRDEPSLLAKVNSERPTLIVLDYNTVSNECLVQLKRIAPVMALSGGDLTGNPIKDVWILYESDGYFWLKVKPRETLLKLAKLENGFVLEAILELPKPEGPKWSTAKSTIAKGSVAVGSGIHGMSQAPERSLVSLG